jgi:hypothetical protein
MTERFKFMEFSEIEDVIYKTSSPNTRKNAKWSVNTWDAWAKARNSSKQLGQPLVPLVQEM